MVVISMACALVILLHGTTRMTKHLSLEPRVTKLQVAYDSAAVMVFGRQLQIVRMVHWNAHSAKQSWRMAQADSRAMMYELRSVCFEVTVEVDRWHRTAMLACYDGQLVSDPVVDWQPV